MSDDMIQRARELRRNQTPHEQELWQELRAKRFSGFKFRRQAPIGRYIVDFVCFSMKIIVELDGSQHQDNQAYDTARDQWLSGQGFTVLRFWNNQWTQQREGVLEVIWQKLNYHPLPNPSPMKGEGLKPDPAGQVSTSTAHHPKPPLSPRGRGAGGEGAEE
ncbi:MAG: endonuclease domain-containing protein [Methylococcales bacterium]|nr:endonuclease domain-containing protein [Methylococcales bacterium]